jgi:hypothetical protein
MDILGFEDADHPDKNLDQRARREHVPVGYLLLNK